MHELINELATFIDDLVEEDVFSGTVLLAKGNESVFQASYGLANRDFDISNNISLHMNGIMAIYK